MDTAAAIARISAAVERPSWLLRAAMLRARPRMSEALASKARWRSSTAPPSRPAALCLSCSTSACNGSNQARVMPSPSARRCAAAAATVLLAGHLAVRPADHAVELTAYGIEPGRDHGGRIARILLKAGKAGARCLLAGDQAPPEAVAEPDRPDGKERVEGERDEALAHLALGAERLAQHQPHQEREGHHNGDHQCVIGDRHAAWQQLLLASWGG